MQLRLYTTEYVVSDRQHASDDGFAAELLTGH